MRYPRRAPDDSFSLEPEDLQPLRERTKDAWYALGKVDYADNQASWTMLNFDDLFAL